MHKAVCLVFSVILLTSLVGYGFITNEDESDSVLQSIAHSTPSKIGMGVTEITVGSNGDFESLEEALTAADDWDTIIIDCGQYIGNFIIDKPLRIIGKGDDVEIIASDPLIETIRISSDDVVIKGIIVSGSDTSNVLFDSVNNCILESVDFTNNDGLGLKVYDSVNITVKNSSFNNNKLGAIYVLESEYTVFSENKISDIAGYGIKTHNSKGGVFNDNTLFNITSNGYISIGSNDDTFIDNEFTEILGYAMNLGFSRGTHVENNSFHSIFGNIVIYLDYCFDQTFVRNTFDISDNAVTGIRGHYIMMSWSGDNTVESNHFEVNPDLTRYAISLFNTYGCSIHNNTIVATFYNSKYLSTSVHISHSSSGNSITGNFFDGCIVRIQSSSNDNLVGNNTFHKTGLSMTGVQNCIIIGNHFSDYAYGVWASDSNFNVFEANTVLRSSQDGIALRNSHHNSVIGNILQSGHYGLELHGSSYNEVRENRLSHTTEGGSNYVYTYGVYVHSSSTGNSIYDNVIEWRSQGIRILQSNENLLYGNYFLGCNAYDDGTNLWNLSYPQGGNYWSQHSKIDEYSGEFQDVPGADGIVDSAYHLPGGSSIDHYPLVDTSPPIAVSCGDKEVSQGNTVNLNGSASTDNVGIVSYKWSFEYGQELHVLSGKLVDFTFYDYGIFIITLNVTDAAGNYDTDVFVLTVIDDIPPHADAGDDQTVLVSTMVSFNSSKSHDNSIGNGSGIVDRVWSFDYDGEEISLSGLGPDHIFDISGSYEVTLRVTDAEGNWAEDQMTVTVLESINMCTVSEIEMQEPFSNLIQFTADLEVDWSVETDASFLVMIDKDGLLTIETSNGDNGTYWVNVTASYETGQYESNNFSLAVLPATKLIGPLVDAVDVTSQYFRPIETNLPDQVTWNLNTDATFLIIDQNGVIENVSPMTCGTYYINVSAETAYGSSDHINYTLTILPVISQITITNQPRLVFDHGDHLDLSDLVINLTWSDGSYQEISCSDFLENGIRAEPQTLILDHSHEGLRVVIVHDGSLKEVHTEPITINSKVTSLQLLEQPELSYHYGDTLDLRSLIIGVQYTNGSSEVLSYQEWTELGIQSDLDNGTVLTHDHHNLPIVLSHGDSGPVATTDTLSIEAAIVSLTVINQPKIHYEYGDELSLEGMSVRLTWSDGRTQKVALNDFDDYGIITDMVNGEVLDHSHHGSSINVSHMSSGIYVDTSVLSVWSKVISVDIVNQPRLEYSYGERLDLTDTLLHIVWSDGFFEICAYQDFDLHVISTTIENGTILDHSHHSKSIMFDHVGSECPNWSSPLSISAVILNIEIIDQPKLDYQHGDRLELGDMTVRIDWSNGSYDTIDFFSFEDYGLETYPLNGSHLNNDHDSLNVSVLHGPFGITSETDELSVEALVVSLNIVNQPRLQYQFGEKLDLSSVQLMILWSDGTNEAVLLHEMGEYGLKVDVLNGTVLDHSYQGDRLTFTHTSSGVYATSEAIVISPVVTGLTIKDQPKIEYIYGELLNLTGLSVIISWSNGTQSDVEFDDFQNFELNTSMPHQKPLGHHHDGLVINVFLIIGDYETATEPLIINRIVTGLSINKQPQLVYDYGDSLDLTAVEVSLTWSDSEVETIKYFDLQLNGINLEPAKIPQLNYSHTGLTINISHLQSGHWAITENIVVLDTIPPVADAGEDRIVHLGDILTFNGSESYDDFGIISYVWNFTYAAEDFHLNGESPSFQFDMTGTYEVTLTVTDAGSNVATDTMTVKVINALNLSMVSPSNESYVNKTEVELVWNIDYDEEYHVDVSIDGIIWIPSSNNNHTLYDLMEGVHTIQVRATDFAGGQTWKNVTVTVDTTPPSLTILDPSDHVWAGDVVDVRWSVSEDNPWTAEVSSDGENWTSVSMIESYTFTGLSDGEVRLMVRVTDAAGNQNISYVTLNVDTTPPELILVTPYDGYITNRTSKLVEFEVHDQSPVEISVSYDGLTWSVIDSLDNHVFDLVEGDNHLWIRAIDPSGNENTTFLNVISDTIAPEAEAGEDVYAEMGSIVVFNGSLSYDRNGITDYIWTFTYDSNPVNLYGELQSFRFDIVGDYEVTLTVMDAVGNIGTDIKNITIEEPGIHIGSGTPDDPYLIFDVHDLQAIQMDLWAYYRLNNDIDAQVTIDWNDGAGFKPIGDELLPFRGGFDGGGHIITDLNINRPNEDNVGLFGYIYSATVSNVTLMDVSVKGDHEIGALVGETRGDALIVNCMVNGTVVGNGWTGGIVGTNYGTIIDSEVSGMVISNSSTGGLVGTNIGTIVACVSHCLVESDAHGGGLVGFNIGSISDSHATGDVFALSGYTGGLVGLNAEDATICNSSASGDVSAIWYVGGLCGYNVGTIYYSHSSGAVHGDSNVGDLVGWNGGSIIMVDDEPPVARAGDGSIVNINTLVTFDGRQSTDNVGIVSYHWSIIHPEGHEIKTSDQPFFSYHFTAGGNHTVILTVADAAGNTDSATVYVFVDDRDTTDPRARAGSDVNIGMGGLVVFDGFASWDDVGIVNYTWSFTYDGQARELYGVSPVFRFNAVGSYEVTLTVRDAAGNWDQDNMAVIVEGDTVPPIARAGPDRTISEGGWAVFDGSRSWDNVAVKKYEWTFDYDGEEKVLDGVMNIHRFIIPGVYTVTLNVTDAAGNWDKDTMTVTVEAAVDTVPPIARAGPDRIVNEGDWAVFDGSRSWDNLAVTGYVWTFNYDGEEKVLEGVMTMHRFSIPGVYTVTLNVTDAAGNWDQDTMTVTVQATGDNTMPLADISINMTGNIAVFDGIASWDDVGVVNYTWNLSHDGNPLSIMYGEAVFHVFTEAGVYEMNLTVRDEAGNEGSETVTLEINSVSYAVRILGGLTAVAAVDEDVDRGTVQVLDGRGSSGASSHTWTISHGGDVVETLYGEVTIYRFNLTGDYTITLNVSDNGNFAEDVVTVTVHPEDTIRPISRPGSDGEVDVGTAVAFDGSRSWDNVAVTDYNWTILLDDEVVHTHDGVTFTYRFDDEGVYAVDLNVSDAAGNYHNRSLTITVNPDDNVDPVAVMATLPDVDMGALMVLDGSASYDNVAVTGYEWTILKDDVVVASLVGEATSYRFNVPGDYTVTLNVTDAAGNWNVAESSFTVHEEDGEDPVAVAHASSHEVDVNNVVSFDASASHDNVAVTGYEWTISGVGDDVVLNGMVVTHRFTEHGVYAVTLNVTDAAGNWNETYLQVTVYAVDITPPIADAGDDAEIRQDQVFVFDGSRSWDNVAVTNHTWTFTYGGQTVILYGETPCFEFAEPGVYVVTLTAKDAEDNEHEDTVTITVLENWAPTIGSDAPTGPVGDDEFIVGWSIVHSMEANETVTWSFSTNAYFLEYSTLNGTFWGTPDEVGSYHVTVTATSVDGTLANEMTYHINVTARVLVTGTVMDSSDQAVAGATISVEGVEVAISCQYGKYSFLIEPGTLVLDATKEGYNLESTIFTAYLGMVCDVDTIYLNVVEDGEMLEGIPTKYVGAAALVLLLIAFIAIIKRIF